jgi:predicted nuclease with TOPRIM domain
MTKMSKDNSSVKHVDDTTSLKSLTEQLHSLKLENSSLKSENSNLLKEIQRLEQLNEKLNQTLETIYQSAINLDEEQAKQKESAKRICSSFSIFAGQAPSTDNSSDNQRDKKQSQFINHKSVTKIR